MYACKYDLWKSDDLPNDLDAYMHTCIWIACDPGLPAKTPVGRGLSFTPLAHA